MRLQKGCGSENERRQMEVTDTERASREIQGEDASRLGRDGLWGVRGKTNHVDLNTNHHLPHVQLPQSLSGVVTSPAENIHTPTLSSSNGKSSQGIVGLRT